jgi:hypothetical protein
MPDVYSARRQQRRFLPGFKSRIVELHAEINVHFFYNILCYFVYKTLSCRTFTIILSFLKLCTLGMKRQEIGEHCIMRSFITYTLLQV